MHHWSSLNLTFYTLLCRSLLFLQRKLQQSYICYFLLQLAEQYSRSGVKYWRELPLWLRIGAQWQLGFFSRKLWQFHHGEYLQAGQERSTHEQSCTCHARGNTACHNVSCWEDEECQLVGGIESCWHTPLWMEHYTLHLMEKSWNSLFPEFL